MFLKRNGARLLKSQDREIALRVKIEARPVTVETINTRSSWRFRPSPSWRHLVRRSPRTKNRPEGA